MWGDPQLWRLLATIATADLEQLLAFRDAWQNDMSVESDMDELHKRAFSLRLKLILTPMEMGLFILISQAYTGPGTLQRVAPAFQISIVIFWWIFCIMILLTFIVARPMLGPLNSFYLATLRRRTAIVSQLNKAKLVVGLSLGLLAGLAPMA